MVTDTLARKTLSPNQLDYFLQLLGSDEFAKIDRKKSRVDRRGIYHEGASATSTNDSETEFPPLLNTTAASHAATAATAVHAIVPANAPVPASASAHAATSKRCEQPATFPDNSPRSPPVKALVISPANAPIPASAAAPATSERSEQLATISDYSLQLPPVKAKTTSKTPKAVSALTASLPP
jgi:hypothetical protein